MHTVAILKHDINYKSTCFNTQYDIIIEKMHLFNLSFVYDSNKMYLRY